MTESSDVAIIDLTNTSSQPLRISVKIGGRLQHIVTLQHGEHTRQVTPTGASWVFGTEPADDDAAASPQSDEPEDLGADFDEEDKKGGGRSGRVN